MMKYQDHISTDHLQTIVEMVDWSVSEEDIDEQIAMFGEDVAGYEFNITTLINQVRNHHQEVYNG